MKQQVRDYVDDHSTPDEEMYLRFISLAMRSSAQTSIIPIQDVLGLGNDCRMNQPGTVGKNWRWRLAPGQVTDEAGQRLLAMSKRYARANWDALKALKKA